MEPAGHSGDVPRIYVRAGCEPLYCGHCTGVDFSGAGRLATAISLDTKANRSHAMPSTQTSASQAERRRFESDRPLTDTR